MEQESLNKSFLNAATTGRLEKTKALLSQGAEINAVNTMGSTALMWAAMKGHDEIVRLLLEQMGPKININAVNETRKTALMFAAEKGHDKIVRLLLEQKGPKVDINAVDGDKSTALMLAAGHGHDKIVKLLLEQTNPKVDINAVDGDKSTTLMLAATNGHDKIVGLLLEQTDPKVDINAVDGDKSTALTLAATNGNTETVKLLLNVMSRNLNNPELIPLIQAEVSKALRAIILNHPESITAFHLFARKHPDTFPGLEMKINLLKTKFAAEFAQRTRAKDSDPDPYVPHYQAMCRELGLYLPPTVTIVATETEDAAGNKTTTDYMGDTSLFERALNYLRRLR